MPFGLKAEASPISLSLQKLKLEETVSQKPSARGSASSPTKSVGSIPTRASQEVLDRITRRAHYLTTQMIWLANNRPDKEKGDPKIGGHPAACASSLHIMGALHLLVKEGHDFIANKPHAAPVDHSYNYLLDLLMKPGFQSLEPLSQEEKDLAMHGLRKFAHQGEPVFQSYHSAYDPDHHGFLPSGTVGIPPVNVGYLAHAYRFLEEHGYEVPKAHFWAVMGDSEFREGSLLEAIPDFAEREVGNLTWIIDYNRQSLDGHRITNKKAMQGTDDKRIERTLKANGWDVIQVQHGSFRKELFNRKGGSEFKALLEERLQDYELQALLLVKEEAHLKSKVVEDFPELKGFIQSLKDGELKRALADLGGHDILALADAMWKSKENPRRPTFIIAHTLKGWGLENAAAPGNHSALPTQDEVDRLRDSQGLNKDRLFASFDPGTAEEKFLTERSEKLRSEMREQYALRDKNWNEFQRRFREHGEIPTSLGISLKLAQYPHTQWMLGQLTAKMTRIANTPLLGTAKADLKGAKELPPDEMAWRAPSELLVTMAPDVGTSTNLNPAMDGKIFGAPVVEDIETELGVKDRKLPDLVPGEEDSDRFIRFEIAECNVMSCVGSYGKIRDFVGVPIIPMMTVYDFFIKRAHDQFFYNLYWKSSFICVGTPSGVTLSPEGAQHGWKSDFQIPNQITWEPFFCQELDWILSDAVRRHVLGDNEGRTGVVIRGVTRGVEQKMFLDLLRRQRRFKTDPTQTLLPSGIEAGAIVGAVDQAQIPAIDDEAIFAQISADVLAGAYYLIDYRGYAGYVPGENVVHLFAMGALTTEAIKASEELLKSGIYANVIVVTSSDLLLGVQAHQDQYALLKQRLNITGDLHLVGGETETAEFLAIAGRRIPIVSVHDGEPGLLDNIGSVIGVKQIALAVRKHSKCGRPSEVYGYHHIDSQSVVDAVEQVLTETALEQVTLSSALAKHVFGHSDATFSFTPSQNSEQVAQISGPNRH